MPILFPGLELRGCVMNKGGGVGVGSASIVLVFAVLCLTVFSMITYVVAGNHVALAQAEARMVKAFYEADALAERILAEILEADYTPETVLGVDIESEWVWDLDAEYVRFLSPISDNKSLYVRLAIRFDSYEILSWRMWDEDEWTFDEGWDVWLGPEDDDGEWVPPWGLLGG
jgi:hypothetical protein